MTATELAKLVSEMREWQRRYFRERSPQCLNTAKDLERKVDRAVKDMLDPQPKLFGEDD